MLVLVRNSARDGKKGDKLAKRWLGPYQIHEYIGKGVYKLLNVSGRILKKTFNSCRYFLASIKDHLTLIVL